VKRATSEKRLPYLKLERSLLIQIVMARTVILCKLAWLCIYVFETSTEDGVPRRTCPNFLIVAVYIVVSPCVLMRSPPQL
jgi:hypothetical protein